MRRWFEHGLSISPPVRRVLFRERSSWYQSARIVVLTALLASLGGCATATVRLDLPAVLKTAPPSQPQKERLRLTRLDLAPPLLYETLEALSGESPHCSGKLRDETCRASEKFLTLSHLQLFAAPDRTAQPLGQITVVALAGQGVRAFINGVGEPIPKPFAPDMITDWGYNLAFPVTVSARRDRWFEIATADAAKRVWFELDEAWGAPALTTFGAGDLVYLESRRGASEGLAIIGVSDDHITVRAEQPSDIWCYPGPPPPDKPAPTRRIDLVDLYDEAGRLRLFESYPKGC
jgi:hypothetical protein